MKTKFILLATALFCLASCNNAEFDNSAVDLGGSSYVSPSGDVYTIEIEGSDPLTKGNVASKSVKTANLEDGYSKSCNAQLKKNGSNVSNATYSWSYINSGASYCALDKTSGQSVNLHGTAAKSQTKLIKVTGTDGVGSVSAEIPVTVTDNFNIGWTNSSMTLTSGEQQANTVQTNHAGASVTVECPSGCKIGKSSASGTSSVTLTTDSDGKATVYVMYTGTSDNTLSLTATASTASGSHSASLEIIAKKQEVVKKKVTLNYSCYENEIKSTISVGSYATSTQYWVSCKQKVYCWDENGQLFSDTFASYYSWKGGSLSKIMSDHNKGLNYSVETKTLETSSSKIYIGFAITTNGLYVDDSNNKKMFPTGSYQADSDYFPVSLSLPSSSKVPTTTANPYGIASSQMQCIYEVSVSGDMTLTVTKGL